MARIEQDVQTKYDRNAVMTRLFGEDCLVFDMANEGHVIACRAPHARSRQGESFLSLLSERDRSRLRDYLFCYDPRPVVLETSLGLGIVLPTMMPGTTLGVALIPDMKRKTLLRLLGREQDTAFVWDTALSEEAQGRCFADMKKHQEEFTLMMRDIRACFSHVSPEALLPGDRVEENLIRRTLAFSSFTGCPVTVSCRTPIFYGSEMDFTAFDAFLLVTMLLCRRISPEREAEIGLRGDESGCAVSIRIPVEENGEGSYPELVWLENLAARQRMQTDCIPAPRLLYIRFVPLRRDWAYLEVKQTPDFDWLKSASEAREKS